MGVEAHWELQFKLKMREWSRQFLRIGTRQEERTANVQWLVGYQNSNASQKALTRQRSVLS